HEHVIGPIEHEPKQSGLVAGGLVPGVVVAVVGAVVAQDFVISRRAARRGRNGKRTLGRMIARLETDGTVRPIDVRPGRRGRDYLIAGTLTQGGNVDVADGTSRATFVDRVVAVGIGRERG